MKKIKKTKTPDIWDIFVKKYPNKLYKDLKSESEIELKRQFRECLLKEQGYVCGYCCSSIDMIDSDGNRKAVNEHILPQDTFPQKSMDYYNIIVSCNNKESCTSKKKNDYSNLLVSPLDADCEEFFSFHSNGRVIGRGKRGEYTIDILGLNSYKLMQARKAIYKSCVNLNDKELVEEYYMAPQNGRYPSHCDMVKYFYDQGFFDEE